ncbi:MAG: AAA family ATPase [Bacillota bacterium]|nr:AAA family ATPase [Bacillota bacterium]
MHEALGHGQGGGGGTRPLSGRIAVAGKGGVGKTTISAGLARLLAREGAAVYAVDADPDVSLGLALGVPAQDLAALPPIIAARDLVLSRTGEGTMLLLNPAVDDLLSSYGLWHEGIRLFRMGGVKGGGTACYCPENSFLRAMLSSIVLRKGEMVLLDMGAGIEHLTRGTARGVDLMLIVTESGRASLDTAATIGRLAAQIGVREIRYVGNKVRNELERQAMRAAFGDKLAAMIGLHEEVMDAAAGGRAGDLEGPFGHQLKELLGKVLSIVSMSQETR